MTTTVAEEALLAIEGERLADVTVRRLRAGHADPDALLAVLLGALALDDHAVGGPAFRAAVRRVQKAVETG
ncbi:MAG: hypothetical protein U1E86_06400 [Burkholderiaceae bacterium]